jgi:hypothetical protein
VRSRSSSIGLFLHTGRWKSSWASSFYEGEATTIYRCRAERLRQCFPSRVECEATAVTMKEQVIADHSITLLRLRFAFSQFGGTFLSKLTQNAVANDACVFGVALVAHGFVGLAVALFEP